jgi:predicted site-specific integrase-resolvase
LASAALSSSNGSVASLGRISELENQLKETESKRSVRQNTEIAKLKSALRDEKKKLKKLKPMAENTSLFRNLLEELLRNGYINLPDLKDAYRRVGGKDDLFP